MNTLICAFSAVIVVCLLVLMVVEFRISRLNDEARRIRIDASKEKRKVMRDYQKKEIAETLERWKQAPQTNESRLARFTKCFECRHSRAPYIPNECACCNNGSEYIDIRPDHSL